MRQYKLQEFTFITPFIDPFNPVDSFTIIPDGSIVSIVLENGQMMTPTHFTIFGINEYKSTDFQDVVVEKCLLYTEQLFVKIIMYIKERDRYLVSVVDFVDVVDAVTSTKKRKVTMVITNQLLEYLNSDYYCQNNRKKFKMTKWMEKLIKDRLTLSEYNNLVQIEDDKEKELRKNNPYRLGDDIELEITLESDFYSKESQFLKIGDEITIKRKNVKHLVNAESYSGLDFVISTYLTDWSGIWLNRDILKHVDIGNIVRVIADVNGTSNWQFCVYMVLVKKLNSNSFLGIIQDTYLLDESMLKYAGQYHVLSVDHIIEVPLNWSRNVNLNKIAKNFYLNIQFNHTGMQC